MDNGLNTCAQDVSIFDNGPCTGDISGRQIKSMGINYSLVGHSERRKNYNDGIYAKEKLIRLLEQDIIPVLCIGENLEERQSGKTFMVIENLIKEAMDEIGDIAKKIIIAYEPIWSISTSGTGIVPKNEEIEEVSSFIKKYILNNYAYEPKVLYGGSVNNKCIDDLEKIDNIDGYLVGGCSLKCEEFEKLINSIN